MISAYQPDDLRAAEKLLQLHLAKLTKAIRSEHWADCASALRAIEDESSHAQNAAQDLSLQQHLSNRRTK